MPHYLLWQGYAGTPMNNPHNATTYDTKEEAVAAITFPYAAIMQVEYIPVSGDPFQFPMWIYKYKELKWEIYNEADLLRYRQWWKR
jgi:hypothetical protein